eukprot:6177439-Pleurochrysis_carterae.AAC.1
MTRRPAVPPVQQARVIAGQRAASRQQYFQPHFQPQRMLRDSRATEVREVVREAAGQKASLSGRREEGKRVAQQRKPDPCDSSDSNSSSGRFRKKKGRCGWPASHFTAAGAASRGAHTAGGCSSSSALTPYTERKLRERMAQVRAEDNYEREQDRKKRAVERAALAEQLGRAKRNRT